MKDILKYIIIILSIFCISLIWGCKKRTQNKLIGSWEIVFYDKDDAPYFPVISEGKIKSINFSFESGDKVYRKFIVTKTDGNDTTVTDEGTYSVLTKKFKPHINISQLKDRTGNFGDNGLWWIDQLNSKFLTMQRMELPNLGGAAYQRYEFQKK